MGREEKQMEMKNRKIKSIHYHADGGGTALGGAALMSVNIDKHLAEMELTPVGVFVRSTTGNPNDHDRLVTFSALKEIQFCHEKPEEQAPPKAKK